MGRSGRGEGQAPWVKNAAMHGGDAKRRHCQSCQRDYTGATHRSRKSHGPPCRCLGRAVTSSKSYCNNGQGTTHHFPPYPKANPASLVWGRQEDVGKAPLLLCCGAPLEDGPSRYLGSALSRSVSLLVEGRSCRICCCALGFARFGCRGANILGGGGLEEALQQAQGACQCGSFGRPA